MGHRPRAGAARTCRRAGAARSSTTSATSCTSSARPRRRAGARPRRAELRDARDARSTTTGSTLALHHLREGDGRPLLLLHGLGEAAPDDGAAVARRRGRARSPPSTSPATGARRSRSAAATRPRSSSPTPTSPSPRSARPPCSAAASAPTSPCCSPAPDRPTCIGAVLADGPGLAGGATFPTSQSFFAAAAAPSGPPDPYALVELSRDLRPPDYAAAFVRLALGRLAARRADHRRRPCSGRRGWRPSPPSPASPRRRSPRRSGATPQA